MKFITVFILFLIAIAIAEPAMALAHGKFGEDNLEKIETTASLTKTTGVTSVVVPPTATSPVTVLTVTPSSSAPPKVTQTATEDLIQNSGTYGDNNGGNKGGRNNARILLKANVQDASNKTGQENAKINGQAESLQDSANFINFCTGKKIVNGVQGRTPGSGPFCNGIPMGDIPDRTNMVASIITFPTYGTTLQVGQAFNITVKVRSLATGTFTNPDLTYYSAPQQLDNRGQVRGHVHAVIQLIDALDTKNIPDPNKFEFFKGINDSGDGQGKLTAVVSNGLPVAGTYRVCTISSAGNHQPVVMPVAQRGAQDDCVRFTVGAADNGGIYISAP